MTIKRSPEISRAIPLEISGNFESFLNLSQAITNDKPAIGKSHAIEYSNTTPNRFSNPEAAFFLLRSITYITYSYRRKHGSLVR